MYSDAAHMSKDPHDRSRLHQVPNYSMNADWDSLDLIKGCLLKVLFAKFLHLPSMKKMQAAHDNRQTDHSNTPCDKMSIMSPALRISHEDANCHSQSNSSIPMETTGYAALSISFPMRNTAANATDPSLSLHAELRARLLRVASYSTTD